MWTNEFSHIQTAGKYFKLFVNRRRDHSSLLLLDLSRLSFLTVKNCRLQLFLKVLPRLLWEQTHTGRNWWAPNLPLQKLKKTEQMVFLGKWCFWEVLKKVCLLYQETEWEAPSLFGNTCIVVQHHLEFIFYILKFWIYWEHEQLLILYISTPCGK